MFYLRESFGLLKKNFFLTSVLGVLTFMLYFSIANFTQVQRIISSKLPSIENEHYFNALISQSINVFSVKRKIEGLPGVRAVNVLSESDSSSKLKTLSVTLGLSGDEFSALSNMIAMKVALNSKVSQSSIKLIREYMIRLTGKPNILMGGVKYKITNEKIFKRMISNMKKWPMHIAIVIVFCFWFVSFSLLKKEILKVSFLIENFQRRDNVAFKLTTTLLVIILLASVLLSLGVFIPQWTYVLGFSLTLFIFPLSLIGKRDWVKA